MCTELTRDSAIILFPQFCQISASNACSNTKISMQNNYYKKYQSFNCYALGSTAMLLLFIIFQMYTLQNQLDGIIQNLIKKLLFLDVM